MRITERGMAFRFLSDVNRSRERISILQSQLASGVRVSKPSDDPQAAEIILRLKEALARNEQFSRNVSDAEGMVESTASALDKFGDIMLELKDLVTRAANGSITDSLPAIGARVGQMLREAVAVGNSRFNGKFLFGGTQTLDPPFTLAADGSAVTVNPNGITGSIAVPVGEGVTQVINIDGQEAFQGTAIFDLMIQLRDAFLANTPPTAGQVDAVSQALSHVAGVGGKSGGVSQSLETFGIRLDDEQIQIQALLSLNRDTDVAEATIQLKHHELMLDAALNAGARVLPKSLLDFLR
jgi:flagellar hook-associated protein 3 FlgL